MHFLRERKTLAQAIPLMGIFAGINALASLLGALLPLSSIFIMFFVPLTSALIVLTTRYRYYPIYLLGSLGVSIAVSAWNFQNTIFYLAPALVLGFAYGFMLKNRVPKSIGLFACVLIETGLFALSLLFIKGLFGVDMEKVIFKLLASENNTFATNVFPTILLAYSSGQVAIIHLFVELNLDKFSLEDKRVNPVMFFEPLISLAFFIIGPLCGFFSVKTAYFVSGIGVLFLAFSIMDNIRKPTLWFWIILGVLVFVSLITFPLIYKNLQKDISLITISLFPASLDISIFVNSLVEKTRLRK